MAARIDHAVSSGTFTLDGETFDVDNNIWVVGDDEECVVIDAPHDVDDILAVVGGSQGEGDPADPRARRPLPGGAGAAGEGGRADHAAPRGPAAVGAHPHRPPVGRRPRRRVRDHRRRHHPAGPAHAGPRAGRGLLPRADLGCVFTGDTLFNGGPGATGRSFSDADLIKASIRARLFDAARRDGRAHRARRRHHDRRRAQRLGQDGVVRRLGVRVLGEAEHLRRVDPEQPGRGGRPRGSARRPRRRTTRRRRTSRA